MVRVDEAVQALQGGAHKMARDRRSAAGPGDARAEVPGGGLSIEQRFLLVKTSRLLSQPWITWSWQDLPWLAWWYAS